MKVKCIQEVSPHQNHQISFCLVMLFSFLQIWMQISNLAQLFINFIILSLFILLQLLHQASLIALLVKNPPAMQEDPLEKGQAPVFLGFPCGSACKESSCKVGDLASILRKIPWRRERLLTPVFWPGEFQEVAKSPLHAMGLEKPNSYLKVKCTKLQNPMNKPTQIHFLNTITVHPHRKQSHVSFLTSGQFLVVSSGLCWLSTDTHCLPTELVHCEEYSPSTSSDTRH